MEANPTRLFPTELHAGVDVISADDQKLGRLHRLVLRRADMSVTHVVVDVGFLRSGKQLWQGGIGLEYDRILPVSAVVTADKDKLHLALTADEFKGAEQYTEAAYEEPQDMSPGEFDLPDVANRVMAMSEMANNTSNFWLVERLKTPAGGVDIVAGTPVFRNEPHDKIGEVERLLLDETSGRTKAFVIKQGFLFKHESVLSTRFVTDLQEDVVHVDIKDEEIEQLPAFKE
jgi:sporulation protein YlmC with PRC-barrel domain